jgi:hypothetical protein
MTKAANETMLQIAVNAAAGGHDLTGFEMAANSGGHQAGYRAQCRNCDQTVLVDFNGMIYSRLDDVCRAPARWRKQMS